jgi:hypothetical protein
MKDLKKKLESSTKQFEIQKIQLKKNFEYQRYLESVVESSGDDFGEVRDILLRYETLLATNNDLKKQVNSINLQQEIDRSNLHSYIQRKNDELLNLTNEFATKKTQLEQLSLDTNKAQKELDRTINILNQKNLTGEVAKMSINSIFSKIRAHVGKRISPTTDSVSQLVIIEQFINDLDVIIKDLQRLNTNGKKK